MRILFAVTIILFSALGVHAQQSNEMPAGPLVRLKAPDSAQWTVVNSISVKSDASSQNGSEQTTKQTSSFVYTKTGNILHVTYTDLGGRVWEIWNVGTVHAFVWADGKSVGFGVPPPPGATEPLYIDTSKSDFPDFSWLTKANFVDIEQVGDRQCLVFKGVINFGGEQAECKATVDLVTRLPVRLEGPTGISDYTFSPNPPASQSIPASIQAAITNEQKREQALARIPGPAY